MSSEAAIVPVSTLHAPETPSLDNKKGNKPMPIKMPLFAATLSSSHSDSVTKSTSAGGNISPMNRASPSYFEDTGVVTNYEQMLVIPSSPNTMKQEILPVSITTNDSDVIYRQESELSDTTTIG